MPRPSHLARLRTTAAAAAALLLLTPVSATTQPSRVEIRQDALAACAAQLDGQPAQPTPSGFQWSGAVRTYYVSAEEVQWDYAPSGWDNWLGVPLDISPRAKMSGALTYGTKWLKALYRGYTDASFTTLSPQPPWQGTLGPTLRSEVNDLVQIMFVNRLPDNYATMHSMGLSYTKAVGEGAAYPNNTEPGQNNVLTRQNAVPPAVAPGNCVVYKWTVGVDAGPDDNELSKAHSYHSYVAYQQDSDSGLIGPQIVYAQGKMNYTMQNYREFPLLYMIYDEPDSWLSGKNQAALQGKAPAAAAAGQPGKAKRAYGSPQGGAPAQQASDGQTWDHGTGAPPAVAPPAAAPASDAEHVTFTTVHGAPVTTTVPCTTSSDAPVAAGPPASHLSGGASAGAGPAHAESLAPSAAVWSGSIAAKAVPSSSAAPIPVQTAAAAPANPADAGSASSGGGSFGGESQSFDAGITAEQINGLWSGNESVWHPQLVNLAGAYQFPAAPSFYTMNGYIFAGGPRFEMCFGDKAIWYTMAYGSMSHVFHMHGNSFTYLGDSYPSISINDGVHKTLPMIGTNPGLWQVICHVAYHQTLGMVADYQIYYEGSCPLPSIQACNDGADCSLSTPTRR